MVIVTAVVDVFEEGGDEVEAELVEHGEEAIMPFLQVAAGGEVGGKVGGVALGLLVLAEHFADDFSLRLGELVLDFALGVGEGGGKRGVKGFELGGEAGEGLIDAAAGIAEGGGERGRNEALGEAGADGFFPLKDVGIAEAVAFDDFGRVGIDQGEEGAGQHDGHAAEKVAVEDFGLGEVGEFTGAGDESGGGEEPVLPDGAQEGVGRKSGTVGGEFFAIVGGGAELELLALAVFEQEEERSFVGLEVDLGVVTGGLEFAIAGDQGIAEGGGREGGLGQEVLPGRAKGGGKRVSQEEVVGAEKFAHQALEGGAEALAVLVVTGGNCGEIGRKGQMGRKAGQRVRPGGTAVAGGGGGDGGFREGCGADFFNVVIFGGAPEDGDGGLALGAEFLNKADGAERLIEGVGGSAVEADLLASENSDSAGLGEQIQGGAGGIGFAEGGDDGLAARVGVLDFGDGAVEGGTVRGVVPVEGLHALKIVEKIHEKRGRPWQFLMADTVTGHSFAPSRTHTYLSR